MCQISKMSDVRNYVIEVMKGHITAGWVFCRSERDTEIIERISNETGCKFFNDSQKCIFPGRWGGGSRRFLGVAVPAFVSLRVLKVPVHRRNHLLRLLIRPIWRHEEGDEDQLSIQEGEDGERHGGPDPLPVLVSQVPYEALHHRTQVKRVHQQELVGAPKQRVCFASFQHGPTDCRERRTHLQNESFSTEAVGRFRDHQCGVT